MLNRRFYYSVKPYLPWHLRNAFRRFFANRTREACKAIWPIDESAGTTPTGWPGWPDGKKFAFVITHDVEGPEGVEKCRQLAELEMQLGFRSSFNFIPEGGYTVPSDLRAWLGANGFEVGVHDLNHDGKLFDSQDGFSSKAKRINHHLRAWGSVGFRAGFMLRNLDWHHQLEIQYDASTFDTDPFEPMPDGAATIFPFWVSAPTIGAEVNPARSAGYVELPYTLPQDSTLFLVLREQDPDIWLRKLDWLAGRGGMALINVHPDYVRFGNEKPKSSTYSSDLYSALLRHLVQRYSSRYWHPLPRQLAGWFKGSIQPTSSEVQGQSQGQPVGSPAHSVIPPRLIGKRTAVILYSNYPADPRPRRAAEAMVEAGMQVDLLCLSQSDEDPREERVNGVQVFRHPMKRRRDSKWTYIWQYSRFGFASFCFLTRRGLRQRYDVVHVHNMPDFLVFTALIPKLRGSRIILDLHDPTPELMVTIFGLAPHQWFVRMLRGIERWSIGISNLVLTPNIAFKNLFSSRSCRADKVVIVMNSPEPAIFDPDRVPTEHQTLDDRGEFRVMHHGLIAHRHGVDLLVEAIALLRPKIPGIRLDIYGGATPFLATVIELAQHLGVADIVRHHGPKSQTEIAVAIRNCHVGVVPNRRSVFTEINFPTRLFEYLAMQRPVVAPNTQGIRDYFGPKDILLFEPENVNDLASRILMAHEQPDLVRDYVARGVAVYRQHLWPHQKTQFIDAVASLMQTQPH